MSFCLFFCQDLVFGFHTHKPQEEPPFLTLFYLCIFPIPVTATTSDVQYHSEIFVAVHVPNRGFTNSLKQIFIRQTLSWNEKSIHLSRHKYFGPQRFFRALLTDRSSLLFQSNPSPESTQPSTTIS